MMRRVSLVVGLGLVAALAATGANAAGSSAGNPIVRTGWPAVQEQLASSHVIPGSALERLILANQDFSLLHREELNDHLGIPLWLRVLYRRNHPKEPYSAKDPTHGYPLVLREVHEWMITHQDLKPGSQGRDPVSKAASETSEQNISGNPGIPRSESMIRINPFSPAKIIGASNNIGGNGEQAIFFSTNTGATWSQTQLPLQSGDSFHSDPTVEWTSDGTAWSTTIGIDASAT